MHVADKFFSPIKMKWENFVEDIINIIPAKLGSWIGTVVSEGEGYFLYIGHSETRMACGGHVFCIKNSEDLSRRAKVIAGKPLCPHTDNNNSTIQNTATNCFTVVYIISWMMPVFALFSKILQLH